MRIRGKQITCEIAQNAREPLAIVNGSFVQLPNGLFAQMSQRTACTFAKTDHLDDGLLLSRKPRRRGWVGVPPKHPSKSLHCHSAGGGGAVDLHGTPWWPRRSRSPLRRRPALARHPPPPWAACRAGGHLHPSPGPYQGRRPMHCVSVNRTPGCSSWLPCKKKRHCFLQFWERAIFKIAFFLQK